MENNIKSASTINPAITENTEYLIVKAYAPVIDLKVGVPWSHVSRNSITTKAMGLIS